MGISEPTIHEENKLDELVASLYTRIQKETDRLLAEQLLSLNLDYENCKDKITKQDYPGNEHKLSDYFYEGNFILGVRIGSNMMAIEFIIPKLETQEVQS
jgi:hypothetical protein